MINFYQIDIIIHKYEESTICEKKYDVEYQTTADKVFVKDVNNAVDNFIKEYSKKFISLHFYCIISKFIILGYPLLKLIKEIWIFFSNIDDATFNHFSSKPKPANESNFIKILNNNPDLLHLFPNLTRPLYRNIVFKYWAKPSNIPNHIIIDEDQVRQTPHDLILDKIRLQ